LSDLWSNLQAEKNLLASHCSQWAPQDFSKGLSDEIDVAFPISNRTNKYQQTNKQPDGNFLPQSQDQLTELFNRSQKGGTTSPQTK
jgi:hypothetical protein